MANEKRLIDANALKQRLDEREAEDVEMYGCMIIECFPADDAKEIVDQMPTVDAVEVVHGRWIDKTEVIVKPPFPPLVNARVDCSVCGHIFWHTSALTYNYCPNCGAKMMDGDGNE